MFYTEWMCFFIARRQINLQPSCTHSQGKEYSNIPENLGGLHASGVKE